jgi:hypothetical protein
MSIADQARRREALKQQMALAAQHLLSEPDKHIGPGASQLGFWGAGEGGEGGGTRCWPVFWGGRACRGQAAEGRWRHSTPLFCFVTRQAHRSGCPITSVSPWGRGGEGGGALMLVDDSGKCEKGECVEQQVALAAQHLLSCQAHRPR